VYRGIWSKADVKLAVENHGGSKRFFRIRCRVRESWLARASVLGLTAIAAVGWFSGLWEVAFVAVLLSTLSLLMVSIDNVRMGRTMYHVLEVVAKLIELTPVKNGKQ